MGNLSRCQQLLSLFLVTSSLGVRGDSRKRVKQTQRSKGFNNRHQFIHEGKTLMTLCFLFVPKVSIIALVIRFLTGACRRCIHVPSASKDEYELLIFLKLYYSVSSHSSTILCYNLQRGAVASLFKSYPDYHHFFLPT